MAEPSARAPKTLYWVDISTIGKLKYRESGGGKFTNKPAAEARRDYLLGRGIEATLYESEPIQWKEVPREQ